MTTAAAQRIYSAKYRRANLAREAARARRWRAGHKNYAGKYVAKVRGTGQRCDYMFWPSPIPMTFCRNRTRHESGLCWRHRARRKASL